MQQDRFRGSLVGLAAGDALGTSIEFTSPGEFTPVTDMRGGGPFHLAPGEWTDDTSMALCLADSLVETGRFDPADQMKRYLKWRDRGYMSSNGRCFDIGNTVRAALEAFERTGEALAGSAGPNTAGNGSLMRLAPVPLFFSTEPAAAIDLSGESSKTTHAEPACVDACRYMGALIVCALQGMSKEELLSEAVSPVPGYWSWRPLCAQINEVASGSFKRRSPPEIRGSGHVVRSLEAALWAFWSSNSFEEGCLRAVNLGEDADTTGAVYGQLAGAFYGLDAIPARWRNALAKQDLIVGMADSLYSAAHRPAPPLPRSYWVVPDRFLAGAYPGAPGEAETERKLRLLLDAGVTCFVNLIEEGERAPQGGTIRPYEDAARRLAAESGRSIKLVRHPIRDVSITSEGRMTRILDEIDAAIEGGGTVYLHCLGGRGRTGTVVGCWLVRHGRDGGEALAEIERLRLATPDRDMASPETSQQRAMVTGWRRGKRS